MAKVIERNVPISEENATLSGHPATNMYDDFEEEIVDIVEIPHPEECNKSRQEEYRKERLKEMEEVVKEDLGEQ